MEPRGRQNLNRNTLTQSGLRTGNAGAKDKFDFKLELQTNSWLRIGLAAKDTKKKFCNLFCHFTVANLREAFHALDGSKAVGIDSITKDDYGQNLDSNLQGLVNRLHIGTYRPLPKKRKLIPKPDGKERPIAISAFEDKMVEWVSAKILTSIYEPLFIRNSFGFRPNRGAHDALKASYLSLKDNKRPHVVEIDLASFFDTVPHRKLIRLLRVRITDRRFRRLMMRFLKAGIMDHLGTLYENETGTPQGSIMSPVLANIYLHYALDSWFIEQYASYDNIIVRYADDAIFAFKDKQTASDFKHALKSRLEKYYLKLNEDKSGMIHFDKTQLNVFHFMGFTFCWAKTFKSSKRYLKIKTEKKRLFKKIQAFMEWIKLVRSRLPLDKIWEKAATKLQGHYNYYGVYTNQAKLNHFYYSVIGLLYKWLNRRSQKRSFTWEQFNRRLRFKPLPLPPKGAYLKPLIDRRKYAYQ